MEMIMADAMVRWCKIPNPSTRFLLGLLAWLWLQEFDRFNSLFIADKLEADFISLYMKKKALMGQHQQENQVQARFADEAGFSPPLTAASLRTCFCAVNYKDRQPASGQRGKRDRTEWNFVCVCVCFVEL